MTETTLLGKQMMLGADGLGSLVRLLRDAGYRVVGPRVRDGAVVYDEIDSADDLPRGYRDEQQPGFYRLHRPEGDDTFFGTAVGPASWKRFLHPPEVTLFRADRATGDCDPIPTPAAPPTAFLGVRACEMRAIGIQDRVLLGGDHVDSVYARNRDGVFMVAVNCTRPGGTCFCASTGSGPRVESGYDLLLTELSGDGPHEFLLQTGSERGAEVVQGIEARACGDADRDRARRAMEESARSMGRGVNTVGLKEILARSYEHPRWKAVEARCLTCGNCTQVCPTCFCTTVDDVTDLSGAAAERRRRWDSCFTTEFSFIHGGSVRTSGASRYRQWLMHKLGTWQDQFGSLGCVGCGRCITWCPAGIDITEEAAAIRATADATTPVRRDRGIKS